MRVARAVLSKKLVPIAILALISLVFIFFVQPANLIIIFSLIVFLSLTVSLIFKSLHSHKYAIIAFITVFIFLSLKALDLFDIINALLAISLIVGVSILIK